MRGYLYVAVAAIGCWVVVENFPWRRQLVTPSANVVSSNPSMSSIVNASRRLVPEIRQDPVPLTPRAEPLSRSSSSIDQTRAGEILQRQPQDESGSDAAKAAAEADGYKRVSIIGKAGDGAWRAKGYRGETKVLLTVDSAGRVSME